MAYTIMKSLQDLEDGKMTRRQLIQCLTLGATAASAACAASIASTVSAASPAAAAGNKGLKAIAYNHISYETPDFDKSRDFYAELLGMKVVYDDAKECALQFGDPFNGLYVRRAHNAGDKARVEHCCFTIANYDGHEVEAELKRHDPNAKSDGIYEWMLHDPDGFPIQVSSVKKTYPFGGTDHDPKGLDDPAVFTRPQPAGAHSFKAVAASLVLRTADITRSRDFYMGLLGMNKIYENDEECFLSFGPSDDHLYIRKSQQPDNKPYVEYLTFTIDNFSQNAVESELKRRGFAPEPDSAYAWAIHAPDGYRFEVARKGLADHMGKICHGGASTCPGGSRG
jgi:catechol 2,3-dioxygenase-like lactoylglutathione lyase family enzyme